MKYKLLDMIGYLLFLILLIVISPLFFVVGGLEKIKRFYIYVRCGVKDLEPPMYYY